MLFLFSLLLLATSVLGQLPVGPSEVPLNRQKRIVGGDFVPVHHVPHQALILQNDSFSSPSQCGAILIAPEWLLTAEHCLRHRDINMRPINVYLGVTRINMLAYPYAPEWTESVVWRRVARYFRGPRVEIGNRTERSDIMLLKLDRKVKTSLSIKPIKLPEVGERWMANQTAVASGFGKISSHANVPSEFLKFIRVPILSKRECLAMHRKFKDYQKRRLKITPETVLCAGNAEGRHDICKGDSGGPLAVCATPLRDTSGQLMCKDNRWKLAGVVRSARPPCAAPNSPSFYVNVSAFSDWIRRTIGNN